MILLSFLCVIYNKKYEVFNFQLIQHLAWHILCNMLNISYLLCWMWNHFWFLHLQESHLLIQSLQPGSWSIYFNGFILDGSARTIRSLKLGNLLYEQKTESLGNISTTLALSVIIGRCFLIIELMLGPSGFYCVVNITGFILLFALFCWTVDLGWFLIFSKALIISFGLWLRAVK